MRIAWFSPYPSDNVAHLRSVYATQVLIPALTAFGADIELFHAHLGDSFCETIHGVSAYHYLSAPKRHRTTPFDIFFYQLEDNSHTDFSRMFLGCSPGITWFHDFLLSYRPPDSLVTSTWNFHHTLRKGGALPSSQCFAPDTYPFSLREMCSSSMALFSNEWALSEGMRRTSERIDRPESSFVPLPIDDVPVTSVFSSEPLFAFLASATVAGRPHKFLPALARMQRSVVRGHLSQGVWCIGAQERTRAEQLLREYSVENVTLITDVTFTEWKALSEKAWCTFIGGRSLYGSLNPYLGMSLAQGGVVALSDHTFGSYVPDEVVLKVPLGREEEGAFFSLFDEVARQKGLFQRSPLSRTYALEHFGVSRVAHELWTLFSRSKTHALQWSTEWHSILDSYRQDLLKSYAVDDPLRALLSSGD
jgi:hypothetical protein